MSLREFAHRSVFSTLVQGAVVLALTVASAGWTTSARALEADAPPASPSPGAQAAPAILPPALPEVELPYDLRDVVILPPDLPDISAPADWSLETTSPAGAEAANPIAPDAISASQVASALEMLLQGSGRRPKRARLSSSEAEDMRAFYAARSYAPVWLQDGEFTARAQAVLAQLGRANEDALDPADYPTPAPAGQFGAEALAESELALSAAAFAYARDARGGRIAPSRLSRLITPKLDLPTPKEALARLAEAPDAGAALADYHPPYAGYRALREKLAEARLAEVGLKPVESAPARALKVKMAGERRGPDPADIIANMERWRWLPRDLGARHIIVNLPDYRLRVVKDDAVIHEARVIVGKPETPTPLFSQAMEYVIVNPSWYIPPSILKNEILPGLAADPDYAAKRGYEVIRRNGLVSVRQPPGERNALGFIKFMLPNAHAVYLHDTPSRALFGADTRAFSHGCVRVDQPFRLAEFVLGDQGYDEGRLRKLIGKGERLIRLSAPIPVHLAYFTLEVDAAGRLARHADIYGHDKRVRMALGLDAPGPRLARLREPAARSRAD